MNPLLQAELSRSRYSDAAERWSHRMLVGLCIGAWLWVLLRQFPATAGWGGANGPEAMLLVAAVLATVSTLARQVSLQNAIMAAGIVGLVGGAAHWISHLTGIPLGPLQLHHATGTSPFQEWFLVPALLWVILLLNARGMARLLLTPGVASPHRGMHLLALSAGLVVAMAMALEPFATTVHRYWLWGDTRLPVSWHNAPLSCLFGWGAVSVIATFAATPCLIIKHPRPAPPTLEPAWLWAMTATLFGVGTGLAGAWSATAVAGGNLALALAAVWRGRNRTRGRVRGTGGRD